GATTNYQQQVTLRGCDLLRGAKRNVDRVVFFVLAEEPGFAFLQQTDDFEIVTPHAHLRAGDRVVTGEERFSGVHADNHDVRTLLVVRVGNEAPFFKRNIRDVGVVWRNSRRVSPTVVASLVSDVVIE